MKKLLAFDIDDTLNVAKTPMTPEMAGIMAQLLDFYPVCIISGQKLDQFMRQIILPMADQLNPNRLANLHLMVTQGTQYYTYQSGEPTETSSWRQVYNYPLTNEQIAAITQALRQAAQELGYWCDHPTGEIIEDRGSQVTFSALGQAAGSVEKYAWDADHSKRNAIAKRAKELAPSYDYEVAGTTSINVFVPGMNKVFGMTKLIELLQIPKTDILYFGDMTQPGGNDYPVVQMGVDTVTVHKWQDTAYALRGIIALNLW